MGTTRRGPVTHLTVGLSDAMKFTEVNGGRIGSDDAHAPREPAQVAAPGLPTGLV
jgi:hypothetical protein